MLCRNRLGRHTLAPLSRGSSRQFYHGAEKNVAGLQAYVVLVDPSHLFLFKPLIFHTRYSAYDQPHTIKLQHRSLQDGSLRRSPYICSDGHKRRQGALTVTAGRKESLITYCFNILFYLCPFFLRCANILTLCDTRRLSPFHYCIRKIVKFNTTFTSLHK